jgi:xylitol oxidase
MKKRKFLKLSGAMMAAPVISPLAGWVPDEKLKNWAGNLEYSTDKVIYPNAVAEVPPLVKKYPQLKVLGSRHCFNRIADSKDLLLALKRLNKVVSLDPAARTVTVEGGINYGQLSPYLHEKGFALPNLASLPHISVAGACTTATHGSGVQNGNLATPVAALSFVAADGQVHSLSRAKDRNKFNGVVVGLGAVGVITSLTLDLLPTFTVRQYVFENLAMAQMQAHFDQIMAAGYSVSLFTDWQHKSFSEVWVKVHEKDNKDWGAQAEFFGARAATRNLHPIIALPAENCTPQLGVPGPWHERLPHFRMGFTPSSGVELQSEYFVPHSQAVEAILAVSRLGPQLGPHLFISEIRTIAADDFWMSPCYKQASVAIHFTWKQDWPAVSKLLPVIERELMPFGVKPHWGKLFTVSPAVLQQRYEKMEDFKSLVKSYDPQGKFRNDFLNRHIFAV